MANPLPAVTRELPQTTSAQARLLCIPRPAQFTMALAKIQLAAIPDDDPTLALDLPLDRIEPHASVMPVQFVRDDDGHFPVRERHAERLSAIVHLRPPNILVDGGLDRTPDELFGQKRSLTARIVQGRAPFGLLRVLGLPRALASPRIAEADRPPTRR
jgi:hypothetical protein